MSAIAIIASLAIGWPLAILIVVAVIHGASKARTDRMLGEEIDSVTGGKG